MKKYVIFGSIFIFVLAMLVAIAILVTHLVAPQKVVWDFRTDDSPAAVGWKPSGRFDIDFELHGRIDFTLIDQGGRVFHQTCFAVVCGRNIYTNQINSVYAHFNNGISADRAVPLAKEVLTKWSGGIENDPNQNPPTVDRWLDELHHGRVLRSSSWYTVLGRNDTGLVRITMMGPLNGGNTECSLMFSP